MDMKQHYQLTLYSQMGPREGCLLLHRDGDGSVWGTLSLAGYDNPVRGAWDGAGVLTLTHSLRTAVGDHVCRSVLHMEGEELRGIAELDGYRMKWFGTPMTEEQTEESSRE